MSNLTEQVKRIIGYWKRPPDGRYLPFQEMAAYAAGGMGICFVMNLIYILIDVNFIPQMYGIDVIHGSNIGMVVAVASLAVQPFLGKILDNIHHSKRGKFQTFLMVITPILGVVVFLAMWTPQFFSLGEEKARVARTVYAYFTCVPTLVLSQMWFAVYNMVPSSMTPDTQERTDMLSPVGLISSFAPTILNILVGPMRDYYVKQGREYIAFRLLGLICISIGVLLTYLIVFKTKERVYVEETAEEIVPFMDGIRQVLKNKPFMVFQLANIFGVLRVFINAQLRYISQYKFRPVYGEGEKIRSLLSPIVGFGATPAMVAVPFLTRKISKKATLIIGQLMVTIPTFVVMLIGFQNLPIGNVSVVLMTILGFLISVNSGIGIVVSPALTADQYDYQQYKTGNRLEGFMNTVTTWSSGIFAALLNYIPTLIQKKIGFQPGSKAFTGPEAYTQANMAISNQWFNIVAFITVVSSVAWILIITFGYRLNEREHRKIMEVIRDRAVDSTFEAKETLQMEKDDLKRMDQTIAEIETELEHNK